MRERTRKTQSEDDSNYVAYKTEEEQLKLEHMGEYVAFADGQRVGLAPDKEALFKMMQEKEIKEFFYKAIVAKKHVFHQRSPRKVRD